MNLADRDLPAKWPAQALQGDVGTLVMLEQRAST
jgi:hypothetical protein